MHNNSCKCNNQIGQYPYFVDEEDEVQRGPSLARRTEVVRGGWMISSLIRWGCPQAWGSVTPLYLEGLGHHVSLLPSHSWFPARWGRENTSGFEVTHTRVWIQAHCSLALWPRAVPLLLWAGFCTWKMGIAVLPSYCSHAWALLWPQESWDPNAQMPPGRIFKGLYHSLICS